MISSMNAALLILRQGNTPRNSIDVENLAVTNMHTSQAAMDEGEAELSEKPRIMSSEYGTVITYGKDLPSFIAAESNHSLGARVSQPSKETADLKFQSKVIEATTLLEPASEKWQRALEEADHSTGLMVGALAEANLSFHRLKHYEPQTTDADPLAVVMTNTWIDVENSLGAERLIGFAMRLQYDDRFGMRDKVTQTETGEFKLSAYQIKTDDGKLVAEMKDNGHYVTYNEDGSIRREMDRADVTRELASQTSKYSRLASLLYSDDNDLQFY